MLQDASVIELGRLGKFRCFMIFHDVSIFDSVLISKQFKSL